MSADPKCVCVCVCCWMTSIDLVVECVFFCRLLLCVVNVICRDFSSNEFSVYFFGCVLSIQFHCPLLRVQMSLHSSHQPIFGVHTHLMTSESNEIQNRESGLYFEVFDSISQIAIVQTSYLHKLHIISVSISDNIFNQTKPNHTEFYPNQFNSGQSNSKS